MRTNKVALLLLTCIMLAVVIGMGVMDPFVHGYYCEETEYWQIPSEDFRESIRLDDTVFEMEFSPRKAYLAGFEVRLEEQPEGMGGTLRLDILDEKGKHLETVRADLNGVDPALWYKVYIKARLKKQEVYTLRVSAEDYVTAPALKAVDNVYLPEETRTGNLLIGYAYAKPTFTVQNKVIMAMFIVAAWVFACTFFIGKKYRAIMQRVAMAILMVAVLTWNYMYNSMDKQNSEFLKFQADSEALVTGTVFADQDGTWFLHENERGYGLGKYHYLRGDLYGTSYLSDDNWLAGYSRTEAAVIVTASEHTRSAASTGNYMVFDNGEEFQITYTEEKDGNLVIHLDGDSVLTPAGYGSLDDVVFYDSEGQQIAANWITAYESQYGLQGKLFKRLARFMEDGQAIDNLYLLCSMAAAVVFVLIVQLILVKYDPVLAGCFYVTFWLSPWIVNFARNLYWVEFTWFIPMAVGLFCAWKIDDRRCRIISYFMAFISIAGKCLCGYEYISVIMMGMVAFLLVDFVMAAVRRDKRKAGRLFWTIVFISIAAVAGFVMAIMIHASLRGQGDILAGVRSIIEQDVLRRTSGADLNAFHSSYWDSFNASVWEVYCEYFHFSTEIITGMAGNLFPLLCLVPLFIFGCEYKKGKQGLELPVMYLVFFLTSVSWFCLAKAHSYQHTHMNFVLWYFGYIQICFYIVINKVRESFRNVSGRTKGENRC